MASEQSFFTASASQLPPRPLCQRFCITILCRLGDVTSSYSFSKWAAGQFKPKKITVDEAKTYYLCGCKYTHNEQGFCDGTHRKEEGIKKYNEFLLKANNKLKTQHEEDKQAWEAKLNQAERKQKVASLMAGLSAALLAVGVYIKYTQKQ